MDEPTGPPDPQTTQTGPEQTPFRWTSLGAIAGLGFLILASYGLLRAPIDALYLEHYSAKRLPLVWVAVALTATGVAALLGRAMTRNSFGTILIKASVISALTGAIIFGAYELKVRGAVFFLYVWKDVYVVVLVEILWSAANLCIAKSVAKWTYGIFLMVGSLGGITGNLTASKFGEWRQESYSVVIGLAAISLLSLWGPWLSRTIHNPGVADKKPRPTLAIVKESRHVLLLLCLVVVVQITTTVIDYGYNQALESYVQGTSERTALGGKINASIETASLALQLLSGFVLRAGGLALPLFGIPLVLMGGVATFLFGATFSAASFTKVANKAMDYSIFRAGKEILYIPLGYREKTQGKAVVDIFGYRAAKGGASLLLFGTTAALPLMGSWALALLGLFVWLGVGTFIFRRWKRDAIAS